MAMAKVEKLSFGHYRLLLFLMAFELTSCAIAQPIKPTISAIVNVASYANGPISPGEMVAIFGSAMGPPQLVNLQLDSQGRVASTLGGVQVLFDAMPAPLVYVSQTQIAAMVPYGIAGRQTTTQVQVVYAGLSSDPFSKQVAASAPGIFSSDASGHGQGAIANSDGSYNSSTNPAAPGDYFTFYLTGVGQTDPPGADGNIATSTANILLPVSVSIAGRPMQVLYAGAAPGNVDGFAQINAVIPADLQYGGSLPLTVQIGDASSQTQLTLAVSGPPAPLPGAPQNLSAATNAGGQIVVTWTAADTLATKFHVERQVGGLATYAEIAVVKASTTTFLDPNGIPGTTYQYRVRAEDDFGFSPYSASSMVSVPVAQLMPPSNLQAVAVSQTQINLIWNPTNTNATSFQIERKTGSTGTYGLLAGVSNTTTAYQDLAAVANTTYMYRMRSIGTSGFSGYSNEATASTPAAPLPAPPVLQASVVSSSQIHLAWTSTAMGVLRFHLERRISTGTYSEINQPGPTATIFDDVGLSASTTYLYRLRVETNAGLSPYSNEVTITTAAAVIPPPMILQAVAISQTQINLTWTSAATSVIFFHVELKGGSLPAFEEIGTFPASSTSGRVTGLSGGTTYTVRLRTETAGGFSTYSNEANATTLPPTTVFIIHGIAQGAPEIQNLAFSLGDPNSPDKIDLTRFTVDARFDWSVCANNPNCSSNCTIPGGAAALANYIAGASSQGANVVLIGYSLGGLLAREAIMSYPSVFANRKVTALITLGTPNEGYPYAPIDDSFRCPTLVRQMQSDYQGGVNPSIPRIESSYLVDLNQRWGNLSFGLRPANWLAMAGIFCADPTRSILNPVGCSNTYPYSDGVVCQTSAYFSLGASSNLPNNYWSDPTFAHADDTILCTLQRALNYYNVLYKPPMGSGLLKKIRDLINGL